MKYLYVLLVMLLISCVPKEGEKVYTSEEANKLVTVIIRYTNGDLDHFVIKQGDIHRMYLDHHAGCLRNNGRTLLCGVRSFRIE